MKNRNMMSICKNILFRLIALILGCVVAFILSECIVRMVKPQKTGPVRYTYDPQLGAIPVPNQQSRRASPDIYEFTYSNNSFGFRGSEEYTYEKKKDFRVLFLGDSFTYGLGVDDNETFPFLVKEHLEAHYSIDIINAGNEGTGSDYALKFFETLGYKFSPDLTCLCFFSNDFADNGRGEYYTLIDGELISKPLSNTITAKKAFLSRIPLYNWLISWSHVANLLKQVAMSFIVKHSSTSSRYVIHYPISDDGYANTKNILLTTVYLSNLETKTREEGSDFLIFYIPSAKEISEYRQTQHISHDERSLYAIVSSVEVISLTPILANSPHPIEALYYVEGHWSPLSHKLCANFMQTILEEKIAYKNIR